MNRRIAEAVRWTICAAGAALIVRGGVRAASADDSAAFTIGVLRRDAVVLPFARFDGHGWHQAWRHPKEDLEVPINLESVPKRWWAGGEAAGEWQIWMTGGRAQTVRVRQPDIVPVFCDRQIGLRTDYVPSSDPPSLDENPYPKDGLAVAPPYPVEPVEVLSPNATELAALGSTIADAMNQSERTIDDHPVDRKAREAVAPRIDAAYAYGAHPRIYYIEAVREYQARPHGGCRATGVGHVWITADGRNTAIRTTTFVEPCDRSTELYMYPLGVVRSGAHLFWVAQYAGWDGEGYYVFEIEPTSVEVRLAKGGGGC